jgi:RNA recognition motif-containing protein
MSTRLYVGNLSFQSSNESLRSAFAQVGEVTDVHLVTDRDSGQSRGFAFVTMGSPAEASNAISQMNGALLDGRPLRVNVAEERQARGGGGGGGGGGGPRGGGGRGGGGGGHRGWLARAIEPWDPHGSQDQPRLAEIARRSLRSIPATPRDLRDPCT